MDDERNKFRESARMGYKCEERAFKKAHGKGSGLRGIIKRESSGQNKARRGGPSKSKKVHFEVDTISSNNVEVGLSERWNSQQLNGTGRDTPYANVLDKDTPSEGSAIKTGIRSVRREMLQTEDVRCPNEAWEAANLAFIAAHLQFPMNRFEFEPTDGDKSDYEVDLLRLARTLSPKDFQLRMQEQFREKAGRDLVILRPWRVEQDKDTQKRKLAEQVSVQLNQLVGSRSREKGKEKIGTDCRRNMRFLIEQLVENPLVPPGHDPSSHDGYSSKAKDDLNRLILLANQSSEEFRAGLRKIYANENKVVVENLVVKSNFLDHFYEGENLPAFSGAVEEIPESQPKPYLQNFDEYATSGPTPTTETLAEDPGNGESVRAAIVDDRARPSNPLPEIPGNSNSIQNATETEDMLLPERRPITDFSVKNRYIPPNMYTPDHLRVPDISPRTHEADFCRAMRAVVKVADYSDDWDDSDDDIDGDEIPSDAIDSRPFDDVTPAPVKIARNDGVKEGGSPPNSVTHPPIQGSRYDFNAKFIEHFRDVDGYTHNIGEPTDILLKAHWIVPVPLGWGVFEPKTPPRRPALPITTFRDGGSVSRPVFGPPVQTLGASLAEPPTPRHLSIGDGNHLLFTLPTDDNERGEISVNLNAFQLARLRAIRMERGIGATVPGTLARFEAVKKAATSCPDTGDVIEELIAAEVAIQAEEKAALTTHAEREVAMVERGKTEPEPPPEAEIRVEEPPAAGGLAVEFMRTGFGFMQMVLSFFVQICRDLPPFGKLNFWSLLIVAVCVGLYYVGEFPIPKSRIRRHYTYHLMESDYVIRSVGP